MMTTILLPVICVLLMVIYVLIKALKKAERDTSLFINELGTKNAFDSERERREREYTKLKGIISLPHIGVEHQLFVVNVLATRCAQREDDTAGLDELTDLLALQCFLLDVMELTGTPVNNPAIYDMRCQLKARLRSYNEHDPVQGALL
jgi:hypothetical protein